MLRKLGCLLIALSILMVTVNMCMAIEPRASEIIAYRSIEKTALGDGAVKFAQRIVTYGPSDKIGFNEIRVEEYYSNSWRTVKTVTSKYGYDVGSYSYAVTYDGVAGRQYRVFVEYYAEDGEISDTKTTTSTSITAS